LLQKSVVNDLKATFNELFLSNVNQGAIFDALSEAVTHLGAAFNILISMLKLVLRFYMNLISVGIDVAKTFKDVWDVIRGKAAWEDVKENLLAIKDGFVDMGKDILTDTTNVVKEAQKQWNNLTENSVDNSKTFADSWEKGSKNARKAVEENYIAAVSGVKKSSEEMVDDAKKSSDIINKLAKRRFSEFNTTTKNGLEKNKGQWESWNEYVKDNLNDLLSSINFWSKSTMELIQTTYSGLSSISDLYYKNEFDKLEISTNEQISTLKSTYETDLANLTDRYEQGLITESEYNESSKALDKKFESDRNKIEKDALKERNDLAKKQFENNKALAIAQVWINAASAIMGFWAAYAAIPFAGPIVAGTLTAAVLGTAGVQTGLIADQQFVPEYAEGTKFHPGGVAMVNEEGGEILDLPTGSRVIPHDLSEQMVNNKEIAINFNNPVVREDNDLNKIANAVSQVLGRQLRTA
jgi:hypothetical protein